MLSQDRRYGLLNALPIHILAIDSFFGRTNDNILPEPLKLGIGEGLPFAVSNHMIGFAACLGFLKAFNKALCTSLGVSYMIGERRATVQNT